MVSKPPIVWVPGHPANANATRHGVLLEGIVIHTAGGSLAAVGSWFANPAAQAGTHFSVGLDGTIHQHHQLGAGPYAHGLLEGDAARWPAVVRENAALGVNPNLYLGGIEHEDNKVGGGRAVTPAQFEASARLSAWWWATEIAQHAHITGATLDRTRILRHSEISPLSRSYCPGWPEELMQRYVARVRELVRGPVSDLAARLVESGRWLEELGRRLRLAAESGDVARCRFLGDQAAAAGMRVVERIDRSG